MYSNLNYSNELVDSGLKYRVHGSEFYGTCGVKDAYLTYLEVPLVDKSYRVSNIMVSKDSPIIVFRLSSISQYCTYIEFYLQVSLLTDNSIHCNLIGNNMTTHSSDYVGELVICNSALKVISPINIALESLLKREINLYESKEILKDYLLENIMTNKLCRILYDSLMHNSRFS